MQRMPGRPHRRLPSQEVMKMRVTLSTLIVKLPPAVEARRSWRCVSSPQSNMKLWLWHRTTKDAVCRCSEGDPLEVPSIQSANTLGDACSWFTCAQRHNSHCVQSHSTRLRGQVPAWYGCSSRGTALADTWPLERT